MSQKIAFLFLTIDNVNWPEYWTSWLDPARSTIYVHPKNPELVTIPWMRDAIISEIVPTRWGGIVEAYLCLMRAAMADENNLKFVVISESCIPVKTFDEFYADVMKFPKKSLIRQMKISKYDRHERINNKKFSYIKHYARFCLSRVHVGQLLRVPYDQRKFFYDMHVGDEFFLTLIFPADRKNPDVINFAVTFDNWGAVQRDIDAINVQIKSLYASSGEPDMAAINVLRETKGRISANPKSYTTVSRSDVMEARQTGCYFWRKFPRDCNILARMRPSPSLYYIHIPKTAGTTIEAICYKYNECVGSCFTKQYGHQYHIDPKYAHMSAWHVPMSKIRGPIIHQIRRKIMFAIVRNPYDRIQSDYKFWIKMSKIKPILKCINLESLTNIDTFVRNNVGTLNFDGHFIPMSAYIPDDGSVNVLHFETINKDFNEFITKTGVKIPQDELKTTRLNATDTSTNPFSAESIRLINDAYREDFIRFNYVPIV